MSKAKTAFKSYYHLSKPGIIRGNLIAAVAGYLFASAWSIDWTVFVGLVTGLALTIAGACATNNYLDRDIDAKMKRTTKRALVRGDLSSAQAITYAVITTLVGIGTLAVSQNTLTTTLAAFAWFAYVVLYGYAKRVTVHGTLVGCISGSIPLVAGYTAFMGQFDFIALQLTALMTTWQMAHFYGIALYRLQDYKSANIPVMPAVYGQRVTKWQVLGYIALFNAVVVWMAITQSLQLVAASVLLVIAASWCMRAVLSWQKAGHEWGKSVFLHSLIVMLAMSLVLVANPLLPL